jgi:membrane protease subunit (stomatin/prohibitin family)
MGMYSADEIGDYLKKVIVSRFNDHLGEKLDSIINLPGRYDELADGLQKCLQEDFSKFGLALNELYITSITPPPEVQKAIDDKSRLGVFDDLDKLVKMKAAMALEKASESTGEAASGMGMGLSFMIPAMFADVLKPGQKNDQAHAQNISKCPDCGNAIPVESKFCPLCGHQQVVFSQCNNCGKNLPPNARFCPRCGHPADEKPVTRLCKNCSTENLPGATYCNQCGEKLGA